MGVWSNNFGKFISFIKVMDILTEELVDEWLAEGVEMVGVFYGMILSLGSRR